ncbi:MAG TPA: hypothetical protein VJZ91_08810 [Blastocatellia bacterium]|nr:hypothetical protein [Blastocatellia bacterium]
MKVGGFTILIALFLLSTLTGAVGAVVWVLFAIIGGAFLLRWWNGQRTIPKRDRTPTGNLK